MDPSIVENKTPVVVPNNQRVCWAIKTLCEEVWNLFPETPVEYSNHNLRNTALDVTFDLTALDAEADRIDLPNLLPLIKVDPRVADVIVSKDDEGFPEYVLVSMRNSARTQDNRESFGLAQALMVMGEDEGFFIDGGNADENSDDVMDGGGA